ncbi:hypothetical protein [Thalassobaculum salexigens]|uniref:hypothetical protein n=1 Tax=Thalassobaculum salexigens TaxID=455360 RepID=UPI00248E5CE0|nr:hypothetical protein [Thalassobaculum salexigens]
MGSTRHRSILTAASSALGLAALLAACVAAPRVAPEGIGYRQARFAEVEAMRAYRTCRDEGLALERQARATAEAARYLAVARTLERCEADLGPDAAHLDLEDRMRVYAVAVQSRMKGGDVAGAREGLERFADAFAGRDLFFDDGTSFIDSMGLILKAHPAGVRAGAGANVPRRLADELARIDRWGR